MPVSIGGCGTSKGAARGAPARARRERGAASATILVLVVILVALLAAAAWWFMGRQAGPASPTTTLPTTSVAPDASAPAEAVAPTADLSVDQLYQAARAAMSANRMVAPAGNNALEFYLAILERQPEDTNATDALRELFPFATGSAEEQINNGDFDEAGRIMGLLTKADPSNYTLTILRSKMEAKRKQGERELAQKAQEEAAAAAAAVRAQAAAAAPAATTPAATPDTPTATGAAPAADAAGSSAVASTTPPPAAAPAPVPEPVGETRDARVVTPPRPSYPAAAVRSRQNGWVEVEFTVAANGEVQNVKVVESNPARVFDREAVRAVEQAKFDPKLDRGEPVASTLRRRIEFKLGN
jgi:periplasmic protein TonB